MSTFPSSEARAWSVSLEATVAALALARSARGDAPLLRSVVVVDEVGSTQDLARERGPRSGDVIVARRQMTGRGRFGRRWVDTEGAGIAVSMVMPAPAAEQLVVRSAVAVARAIEQCSGDRVTVGIKWPNDLLAPDGGKLGGILIERVDDLAILGVGINVRQRDFPPEIADRARSLAMLGIEVTREDLLAALLVSVDRWFEAPAEQVLEHYRHRDVLRGRVVRLAVGDRVIEGHVLDIDPGKGIRVRTEQGEVLLCAARTTLAVDPGGDGST